jgi:UDP-N-acetylglucosamine--N-acetylmuramyl-(pentapeptide) pyrophosphoryl-undecaprenol N-acetylglucosamine transferase
MKYIISGGGTGGHIFPAIAIAQAIQEWQPDAEILFVGAKGKMEMTRVPRAGYQIEGLWISGLSRKFSFGLFLMPLKIIVSLWQSWRILRNFKPDVVIGVGGYASAMLLWTAAKTGVRTVIHEQNSFAGLTNRILGKSVDKICVAAEGMEKFFPAKKIVMTGNPVRKTIVPMQHQKEEAALFFSMEADLPTLLVVGGSLGARTLNNCMRDNLKALQAAGLQVIWQAGTANIDEYMASTAPFGRVKFMPFIDRMDYAYAMADVVVARAGALTIAELAATASAAILVPSPNVTDDHQTANAMSLVNKNAAILVTDADAPTKLIETILALVADKPRCEALRKAAAATAISDAPKRIVDVIFDLVGKRKK